MTDLDIVLINPKTSALGSFDFLVAKSVPLSIGYLAAYLRQRNYNVAIVDEEIGLLTREKLLQITNARNQLFGISCLTANISRSYKLAELIKSVFPAATVVCGGIHCTILPEEVLANPAVDLVVRGEGEAVIEQIVLNHRHEKGFEEIPSCSYRSNGKIAHNPMAPLIDMDSLPNIPYSMFDSKVYDMGFIISSRGCPYNCAFCSQRVITGNRFRYRSTEKVISEIDTLVNLYAPSNIVFLDDIFTVNKRRVYELCDAMIQRNLHTRAEYTMVTRGDCIDEELLKKLKAANFTGLAMGVETASEELMRFLNKRETVQEIVNGINLAKKYHFSIDTVFIYGIPGETRADRVASFNLAVALDVDKARFNNATPYPGTKFYEVAKQEDNLNIAGAWENFTPTGVLASANPKEYSLPYYPKGSTAEEIIMDVIQANTLYFLQPKRLWKLIKNSFDRKGTKWLVFPEKWWKQPKYIRSVFQVITLNLKRLFLLLGWALEGKLLTQYKVRN